MWSAAYMSVGLKPVIIGSKRACSVLAEGLVGHGDLRVGERVVIERRVRLQVVGRREIAVDAVRPLLLQRNAEQRDSSDLGSHDVQEVVNVRAFLDVVRQVEMRIVEFVVARACACDERRRADRAKRPSARRAPI